MEQQLKLLLHFFKATGQAERLRVLGGLACQPTTALELGQQLGLKETAVNHHLRILQQAGLVKAEGNELNPTFSFDQAGLAHLQAVLDGRVHPASAEEQLLQRYVQDDQLQAIPNKAEDLSVILAWLGSKFEPNRRYTEQEVTDLVGRHYHKPLILRRLLADHRFLRQTGRQYWRPIANYTHVEG